MNDVQANFKKNLDLNVKIRATLENNAEKISKFDSIQASFEDSVNIFS